MMLGDDDELHSLGPASDEESGDTPTRSTSPSSCEGNKASLVKRPWTPEEDDALMAAVRKYGACRWSMIATHLSTGRVGKQCRERCALCRRPRAQPVMGGACCLVPPLSLFGIPLHSLLA